MTGGFSAAQYLNEKQREAATSRLPSVEKG